MTSFPISPLPTCPARPVLRGSVLLWGLPPWTRWERGQVGVHGEGPTPAASPRPHPMDIAGAHVPLFGGADRTQLWGSPSPCQIWGWGSACSQPGPGPQPPLGSPVLLASGHAGIGAALDVSLTFLAWGKGEVGGLLSTSSALSLQPISPCTPHVGGADEPKPASCQL